MAKIEQSASQNEVLPKKKKQTQTNKKPAQKPKTKKPQPTQIYITREAEWSERFKWGMRYADQKNID